MLAPAQQIKRTLISVFGMEPTMPPKINVEIAGIQIELNSKIG